MTGGAYGLFLMLLLVLPLSALLARRLPAGKIARLALIWVALFAAATVIVKVATA